MIFICLRTIALKDQDPVTRHIEMMIKSSLKDPVALLISFLIVVSSISSGIF